MKVCYLAMNKMSPDVNKCAKLRATGSERTILWPLSITPVARLRGETGQSGQKGRRSDVVGTPANRTQRDEAQ